MTVMCLAQVLAMLGSVEEKRILELGAGIGRFTGHLAAPARSVLAVDFMENLIEENKRANSHRSVSAGPLFYTPLPSHTEQEHLSSGTVYPSP